MILSSTTVYKRYIYQTYFPSASPILSKLRIRQDFLCVKVSKLYFPWYAPIPLAPTPPNGNSSTKKLTKIKTTTLSLDTRVGRKFSSVCKHEGKTCTELKDSRKQPENCSRVSLTQIEPQLVFPEIRSISFLFLEKMYMLSGFSLNQCQRRIKL